MIPSTRGCALVYCPINKTSTIISMIPRLSIILDQKPWLVPLVQPKDHSIQQSLRWPLGLCKISRLTSSHLRKRSTGWWQKHGSSHSRIGAGKPRNFGLPRFGMPCVVAIRVCSGLRGLFGRVIEDPKHAFVDKLGSALFAIREKLLSFYSRSRTGDFKFGEKGLEGKRQSPYGRNSTTFQLN